MKIKIFMMLLIFFTCCARENKIFMGNPASKKCSSDGGKVLTVKGEAGEYGVCLFSDGSVCEEWRYFRNQCKPGDCKVTCRETGTDKEGLYDCNKVLISRKKCSEKTDNYKGKSEINN